MCPVCKKEFLSSEILIIHFDENHFDEFQVPDDAICLADYCDIIRCDVLLGNTLDNQNLKRDEKISFKSSNLKSSELVLDSSNEPNLDCDKAKLKNLFDKCTRLVRQCALGTLELESSINEFDKLEKELTKSICSYLTCDLYFTNNLDKPKKISTLFILFLILFIICLFSICYCFVWSFFENDSIDLQLIAKLQSVYKLINLAKLVQFVYLVQLVNLVKCKWLCKKVNKVDSKESSNLNDETEFNNELSNKFKDEFLLQNCQQIKLPFKMKQSIFSVRSSSSDSIKKMQEEHLRNLEIHEKQLRELEKSREDELSKQKIIEEDQFDESDSQYTSLSGEHKIDDFKRDQFENELDKEIYRHLNKRRFTSDGEIVSTKSKSEDKDSYYDLDFYETDNNFRNLSNNDSFKMTKRKDQRRPSEQSVCSNSACPTRIKITNSDLMRNNEIAEEDQDELMTESQNELNGKLKIESKNDLKVDSEKEDTFLKEEKSPHKRVWEIAGDITLLNQARLKLLEQKTARQLNYQFDENNQSNRICKITKFSKPEIELKEFKTKPEDLKLINRSKIDQSIESKKILFKQNLSALTNKKYMMNCRDNVQLRKPINPLVNQISKFHQQTRSQPTSLSQTPRLQERPDSTNSSPCNR